MVERLELKEFEAVDLMEFNDLTLMLESVGISVTTRPSHEVVVLKLLELKSSLRGLTRLHCVNMCVKKIRRHFKREDAYVRWWRLVSLPVFAWRRCMRFSRQHSAI